MKLSERLAKAAGERADAAAAGTTIEDWKRRQQPAQGRTSRRVDGRPDPATPMADAIVLVAPQTPVTTVDPEPGADPRSVCPTCGRTGELGMVDLHGRTADWSCEACGTMWRVTLPSAPHPGTADGLPRL